MMVYRTALVGITVAHCLFSHSAFGAEDPQDGERPPAPAPAERLEQRGLSQWHVLRRDAREYVRFSDVQKFYAFQTLDSIGDELILESPRLSLSLRFHVGMRQAAINGYKCFLSFPPVRSGPRVYLSRIDLALLVDPTIRPPRLRIGREETPRVLIAASPADALAFSVAGHLRQGLGAFGMQAVTELPGDAGEIPVLARIQLVEHGENEELSTLTLAPQGAPAHGVTSAPRPSESPDAGNGNDRLNIALGMALHATLMETVEGLLDGGLRRDRRPFLQQATEPAATINLPSEATTNAEVIGAALIRGLRRFRGAVDRE